MMTSEKATYHPDFRFPELGCANSYFLVIWNCSNEEHNVRRGKL